MPGKTERIIEPVILSIINWKGGVGKTTTTLHLGAALANQRCKVLLIDLDPQRNLSIGLGAKDDATYTVKNFLDGDGKFRLKEKQKNLFLLPGNQLLESKKYNKAILKERLEVLKEYVGFNYILIDCPPRPLVENVASLGEIALIASNHVLCPIAAELYSLHGINDMIPAILRIKEKYNPKLNFLGYFFSKVLVNIKRFSETKTQLENSPAGKYLLSTFIRQDENIESSKQKGKTIFQIAPQSRASLDYKELAALVKNKIK